MNPKTCDPRFVTLLSALGFLACFSCFCGCEHQDERAGTTTATGALREPGLPETYYPQSAFDVGASQPSREQAAMAVAIARCEHEADCGNMRNSREAAFECVADTVRRTENDLSASPCTRGVTGTGVATCLSAIRRMPCSRAPETLSACGATSLCVP
jgi:hypothetical protein